MPDRPVRSPRVTRPDPDHRWPASPPQDPRRSNHPTSLRPRPDNPREPCPRGGPPVRSGGSRCPGHGYREILQEKVAATLDDPSEVDDEIRSLVDAIRS